MRFKDVFSIIGPAMIGPSSSHTAGAVRIGQVGRQLFGGQMARAEIIFYGSFADTYRGHGTDLAVVSGLLGFATDDVRIPDAIGEAALAGLELVIRTGSGRITHPNTVDLLLSGDTLTTSLRGVSIGGGNIEIQAVDEHAVTFSGEYPTLLIYHDDRPGVLADITQLFKEQGMNIGYMDVDRTSRTGSAMTVIEADQSLEDDLMKRIAKVAHVKRAITIDLKKEEGKQQ
ncbi:L-serine dehydratase [Paenibacillus sp. UNCCL117]|uniref:L-serine ammonia-lyase, iron-sulfur-dependent subunit beta n=1 Tax=unclassified Paenibacillus TaxID=185978 RepID=UPI000880E1E3|nr:MULTISPECIES: L-serine ammonia-lyase, iron-sulfur-dependent subunit beta [unclassified Paenibacillus]SDC89363.1 L-serine dehydratase [Paenibacillus sp. cl123]SFW28531.1 L-serine dehydratase [Paenibacillus sp. UNCCL117]